MSMDERDGSATRARARIRAPIMAPIAVAAITALTGFAILVGITASVAPLIVVFVLVCPGLALVGALRLRDPLFEIVLGVALSVSIAGLLATMELFIHAWAPGPTLNILIAISVAGLLLDADLIPRRLWVSAAAKSSAAGSRLRRGLGRQGSDLGEPLAGDAPVSAVPAASSETLGSMVGASMASTPSMSSPAVIVPAAPSMPRSTRPRTVPAMGPMLVTADRSAAPEAGHRPDSPQPTPGLAPPEPAEGLPAPEAADTSDDVRTADQSGPSASTPAPAPPAVGRSRKGSSRDESATLPPPTLIIARRLPEELRPKPPSPARRVRPKGGVAEEAPEASEPTGSLRSAVRGVVGDLVDRRDGKQ